MRYDDWDIVLFARDSRTPLQEFRTACYTSTDEYGVNLPILTCFIASLPPSTPFRLSLHSWSSPAKTSALIESQLKADQKVVFGVKVCVDCIQAFRGLFEPSSEWPQNIDETVAVSRTTEQSSDRQKLEFPDFNQQVLLQPSWHARDATGKIIITLSEQIVSGAGPLEKAELGVANDIVCYSFQHAPKNVLEQAGISWPIRNPLYLAHTFGQLLPASQNESLPATTHHASLPTKDSQLRVSGPRVPSLAISRTGSPEPHARVHPRPRLHTRVPRAHTLPASNMSSLPGDASQPTPSELEVEPSKFAIFQHQNSSSSQVPGNMMSHSLNPTPPWLHNGLPALDSTFPYEPQLEAGWSEKVTKSFGDPLTGVTSRPAAHTKDGHSIGSMLPKLHASSSNVDGAPEICMVRPSTSHGYFSPSLMNVPQMHRTYSNSTFDTAAGASQTKNPFRNSNRSFLNSRAEQGNLKAPLVYYTSNAPNKENRPSSQSRGPTSIPHSNRVSKRSDLASANGVYGAGNGSIDPSLTYWNSPALELMPGMDAVPHVPRFSHAHAPSAAGYVRGQKEYRNNSDSTTLKDVSGRNKRNNAFQPDVTTRALEIIDLDSIDANVGVGAHDGNEKESPPRSGHKSTSSIDSTARLERTLFSALGDELNHLNSQVDTTDMGPELAQALGVARAGAEQEAPTSVGPSLSDEDLTVKRKRQGTLGGERDPSPTKKKEKAQEDGALGARNDVPMLRGD